MESNSEKKGKKKDESSKKYSTKNFQNKTKDKKENKSTNFSKRKSTSKGSPLPKFGEKIRLNKFIANAGICSRREADVLIEAGVVSVNNKVVTELGYKVSPTDKVSYDGETITPENKQYILVNKPLKFNIKYSDNPSGNSKSVYQLIKNAGPEFLYPVGKLNVDECGLIIYTNDSDLEKKLTHPSFRNTQLFHLTLDKEISSEHLEKLTKGVFVDNKLFSLTEASYINNSPKNEIGVKALTSKHGIIKSMLKTLGYTVVKLDRSEYAGLTKLNLTRGKYRHLTKKEISILKMS